MLTEKCNVSPAPRHSEPPRKVFISHNKADRKTARLLAIALVEQGIDVWYDEWNLSPGDSIAGGIEQGLSDADVLVLVWSHNASRSNWVGAEIRAYIQRRVKDHSLRIIPLMLDETPLPTLVADYRGFRVARQDEVVGIAADIAGSPNIRELSRRLQERFLELTDGAAKGGDLLPYRVCPMCGSGELERFEAIDYERDDTYYCIRCKGCGWEDGTEI